MTWFVTSNKENDITFYCRTDNDVFSFWRACEDLNGGEDIAGYHAVVELNKPQTMRIALMQLDQTQGNALTIPQYVLAENLFHKACLDKDVLGSSCKFVSSISIASCLGACLNDAFGDSSAAFEPLIDSLQTKINKLPLEQRVSPNNEFGRLVSNVHRRVNDGTRDGLKLQEIEVYLDCFEADNDKGFDTFKAYIPVDTSGRNLLGKYSPMFCLEEAVRVAERANSEAVSYPDECDSFDLHEDARGLITFTEYLPGKEDSWTVEANEFGLYEIGYDWLWADAQELTVEPELVEEKSMTSFDRVLKTEDVKFNNDPIAIAEAAETIFSKYDKTMRDLANCDKSER